MRVVLHPEANAELRFAALWYEERREGLGDEFVAVVADMLRKIGVAPSLFPRWPQTGRTRVTVQKATTKRFPYAIAFEQHESHALVLAVAHQKRRPLYWLRRASL